MDEPFRHLSNGKLDSHRILTQAIENFVQPELESFSTGIRDIPGKLAYYKVFEFMLGEIMRVSIDVITIWEQHVLESG